MWTWKFMVKIWDLKGHTIHRTDQTNLLVLLLYCHFQTELMSCADSSNFAFDCCWRLLNLQSFVALLRLLRRNFSTVTCQDEKWSYCQMNLLISRSSYSSHPSMIYFLCYASAKRTISEFLQLRYAEKSNSNIST